MQGAHRARMTSQICMHELVEPLRTIVVPQLHASTLAALRGTCQTMLYLLDHDAEAAWLAAASRLLPKGCLDRLHRESDATSMQAQLRSQAAAEAEIRAGGAHCGRVTMTHRPHADPSAEVKRLEWSPCASWVAVQLSMNDKSQLYVAAAAESHHSRHLMFELETAVVAGLPSLAFEWLLDADGSLMISRFPHGSAPDITICAVASMAKADITMEKCRLQGCGLSPCKTLLLVHDTAPTWQPTFSIHNAVAKTDHAVQVPPFQPQAEWYGWSATTRWSYDSSLCTVLTSCSGTQGSPEKSSYQLIIYAASGRLQRALEVGPCSQYEWSPTAYILAIVTADSFKLWDVSADSLTSVPAGLDLHWTAIDWSPDGKHLAVACKRGWVDTLWSYRADFSCILSAAGTVCWAGLGNVGRHQHSGLAREHESRWSADGGVCLGIGNSSQQGLMLVMEGGRCREYGIEPSAKSSISPCGLVIVSHTHSGTLHNQVLGPEKVPSNAVHMPFLSAPYDRPSLAWHPSSRLSSLYAILDFNANLRIVDGSSGTVLRMWLSQDLFGSCGHLENACSSMPTVRLAWSPDGRKLCVAHAASLVLISFG